MSDQNKIEKKGNGKLPIVLAAFAISTAVLLLISWILMLAQPDPAVAEDAWDGDKWAIAPTVASLVTNAIGFVCFLVILLCAFKMNHTTTGKYDQQIWKFALIGFVLSGLSLIFVIFMTVGLNQIDTQTGFISTGSIGEVMNDHYSIFASFFTLFIAGAIIFGMFSGIITIRHSYKIKVEVTLDKTADSLVAH